MWDLFIKIVLLLPIPLITVFFANIIPFLTYRQNGDKNKSALMDTLAREMDKKQPCAYLVESCVARLHNIRPIPWAFLRVVLPYSNSMEIIQLVSSGRRILHLFDISVKENRPLVQYAAVLSKRSRRRNTMITCVLLGLFSTVLLVQAEWQLLKLLFENSLHNDVSNAAYGEVFYLVVQMIIWAAASVVFTRQGVIIMRADKRLSQICELIAVNVPISNPRSEHISSNTQAADS